MGFIQYKQTTGGNVSSLTSPSLTMSTGSLIVVVATVTNGGVNTLNSVTDGTNTYQVATGSAGTGGSGTVYNQQIWYAMNVTSGARTVTMNWQVAASGGFSQIQVAEYSGIATSSALDQGTVSSNGSNAVTVPTQSTSATETYWNDLIVAACKFTGSGSTWSNQGAGTPNDRTGLGGLSFADLTLSTPMASLAFTGTTASGSGAFVMSIAAFKFPSGSNIYDGPGAGNTGGQRIPYIGSTPSAPNAALSFTSYEAPVNTPTTAMMPFTPYDLLGNLLNAGFHATGWPLNVFILAQEYWDKTTDINVGQLYPVPPPGGNGLGQSYPGGITDRRHYPF